VRNILNGISEGNVKEVKGLEHRLYGLDHILADSRQLVKEQADHLQVSASLTWDYIMGA